jgi:hypothetical protein
MRCAFAFTPFSLFSPPNFAAHNLPVSEDSIEHGSRGQDLVARPMKTWHTTNTIAKAHSLEP